MSAHRLPTVLAGDLGSPCLIWPVLPACSCVCVLLSGILMPRRSRPAHARCVIHVMCSRACTRRWLGVPEDHVTGSAHAVLGPFFAAHLGKQQLSARQCSARGGELEVRVNSGGGKVVLCGGAVVVMSGSVRL